MSNKVKIALIVGLILIFISSSKKISNMEIKTNFTPNTRQNSPRVFSLLSDAYSNKYTLAAMLATILRESDFEPQSEQSYKNTSAFRIRKIFGSRMDNLSDAQIDALKKDDVKFFNHVYGGRYGNAANEGYKNRGRRLHPITYKGNNQLIKDHTDIDAVNDPDSINNLDNADKTLLVYSMYTMKALTALSRLLILSGSLTASMSVWSFIS